MHRREFLQSTVSMAAAPTLMTVVYEQTTNPQSSPMPSQRSREELVTVRTEDDLVMSGLLVTPEGPSARSIAVIWVHGASENFYLPNYVNVARATASLGHPTITVNTRMHDIGCVVSYGPDVSTRRGGSYWGLPSRQPIDIAAWVQFASDRGYRHVVMVGHSAGGPAAVRYLAERNDSRVIGLVMAFVSLLPSPPRTAPDSEVFKAASEMVAQGRGQELLSSPRISAATFLDYAQTPVDIWDFYGTETSTSNPAIMRVRCPLLAWFGSRGVGTAADLQRLKKLIAGHGQGPSRVATRIIEDADHNYDGQEPQVAGILTSWIGAL